MPPKPPTPRGPTPYALALGRRLAALRAAAGKTTYALAAALGVAQPRVCEWERGRRSITAEYLSLLSAELGVSLAVFDDLRADARLRSDATSGATTPDGSTQA